METYERLICELGHCLLTKGLNNDFYCERQGSGDGCDVHRGLDTPSLQRTRRSEYLTDVHKLQAEKVNLGSGSVSGGSDVFVYDADVLKSLASVLRLHC